MNRPIGFFDSGLGGISVLREAAKVLPNESFIFYGDNLNAPYGDKTEQEITDLTMRCLHELLSRDVKAIMIACNTATATCINLVRNEFRIPVLSVEPAIKPACRTDGDGNIFMLATTATTRLQRYLNLQASMPSPDRIINVPCPGLADRIETGEFGIGMFDDILDEALAPYFGYTADAIVLGCTHYIFIQDAISEYFAKHFIGKQLFFDGNQGAALHLKRVLKNNDLLNLYGTQRFEFISSGDIQRFQPLFDLLINK